MRLKKIVSILLLFVVGICCMCEPVNAKEISNSCELQEYENDSTKGKVLEYKNKDGEKAIVEIDSVDRKIEGVSDGKISIVDTYEYKMVIEDQDTLNSTSYISTFSSGNKDLSKKDSSYSVEGYLKISYDVGTYRNADAYKLTKVSGGYTILDGTVSVSSQSVTYGISGVSNEGVVQMHNTKKPTSSSWSYSTGYTPYLVLVDNYSFGATYNLTLKRYSSSTWNLSLHVSL